MKAFTHRHGNKNSTLPKYDSIPQSSHLQTGRAHQNFVISNRARFAAVIVGLREIVRKLERDKRSVDITELETNQIEADSCIILHIDKLIEDCYFNIVVKSMDSDVIILCIYYTSLCGLEKLFVDATVPKKKPKIIDYTYINNELINKYGVNPLHFLIIYALSGCDTCSFIRNISKKNVMQTLFDEPISFTDLEKLTSTLTNTDDVSLIYEQYL